MRNKKTMTNDLICIECGYIQTIQRLTSKQKKESNTQDIYCPCCTDTKKFIDIRDKDTYYFTLINQSDLTDLEKHILDLLSKGNELNGKRNIR